MKKLVLAEKPSVARDLAKVLGANEKHKTYIEGKHYIVTWALGHLLTLKMPEDYQKEWREWSFDTLPMIPKRHGIKPLPKTTGQLKSFQRLANRSDVSEVIIATDAGREGELVARWILEYAKVKQPVKRLWISSQTEKAIKDGFNKLQSAKAFDDLYESAVARSQADWLVGLNVTRALTVKYDDNLSAGRVQTPTLALVDKQDRKIDTFKPATYYVIQARSQELETKVMQSERVLQANERNQVEAILKKLPVTATVNQIKESVKKEKAPLPYDLTELQREANQRYGYSAKKTLSIIQRLYEIHKIVTYPRTDSKYLTNDMQSSMKERVLAVKGYFSEEVQPIIKNHFKIEQPAVFQNNRVTDHHGIIPTEQVARSEKLDLEENRVYQLICKRFLALFYPAYVEKRQQLFVSLGEYSLQFKQTAVVDKGWKLDNTTASSMTQYEKGQTLSLSYQVKEEITTAPAPMNEGQLLGKMEHFNLGTPATRAEIIERLISSELIERQNNRLRVTPKGKQVLSLVNPALVSPELTEKWETKLEAIANGELKRQAFIKEIEQETTRLVSEIKQSDKTYKNHAITSKKCPECGELLKEKNTKNGKLYVCTNQSCSYSRRKDPKLSNKRCPQCHKKMEIHSGKTGDFFKCKYCVITEKVSSKQERKKKMSKHEERKLVKKYSQAQEPEESPLALALKAAMKED
ncbi:DNA topoisomerase 3 [Vagococcus xieshaowenii]|uniref:DNA topoisomerase n=1 Tax=Vagococcus xieshaowenii TaxID=2562451 RepID=A0AAJ5EH93_9ENTE|nr:DNA topoisomerase 3 [Vagococcus xieshaowenii]QCA28841.1 DNA topoisomerase III [Vagococcus xieshaowenii]TFZ43452.1 DNA topoisomerase III [Vagococcus xieshaowenii]